VHVHIYLSVVITIIQQLNIGPHKLKSKSPIGLNATDAARLKKQSKALVFEGNDHAVYIMGLQKDSG